MTGVDHILGNDVFCKMIADPKSPDTVPVFQGTLPLVDACPGSSGGSAHSDSFVCYDAPEKKPDCECHGNPIKLGAKEKVQIEKDYTSKHGLNFIRYYSSKKFLDGIETIGLSWGHSYSKKLRTSKPHNYAIDDVNKPKYYRAYSWKGIEGNGGDWYPNEYPPLQDYSVYSTIITRPDGYGYYFASTDGGTTWHADADGKEELYALQYDGLGNITQWKLITAENEVEYYDQDGMLTSIVYPSGYVQTLTYISGLLTKVADSFGRELNFTHDEFKRLLTMVDPAGNTYTYTYQDTNTLNGVTYPDGLRRIYLYNEPLYMVAQIPDNRYLTGIAAAGVAFDYAVSEWKKQNCKCQSASTPGGSAGNAAAGAANGTFGPHASKPRTGAAGGGKSGSTTSVASQVNHYMSGKGWYSKETQHMITKAARGVSKYLPWATGAFAAFEIYDVFNCD